MSTTTQPPDITAHLDAAERAATTLVVELCAALAMVPEGDGFNSLRYTLGEVVKSATSASKLASVRSTLAEMARVKGPRVEICYPGRGALAHGASTGSAELAAITSGSFIMRGGVSYSRKTGKKIGHRDAWSAAPYITEAERARVLALPRPPAPARPRAASKEPRQ
jgi:hypothetical protein